MSLGLGQLIFFEHNEEMFVYMYQTPHLQYRIGNETQDNMPVLNGFVHCVYCSLEIHLSFVMMCLPIFLLSQQDMDSCMLRGSLDCGVCSLYSLDSQNLAGLAD